MWFISLCLFWFVGWILVYYHRNINLMNNYQQMNLDFMATLLSLLKNCLNTQKIKDFLEFNDLCFSWLCFLILLIQLSNTKSFWEYDICILCIFIIFLPINIANSHCSWQSFFLTSQACTSEYWNWRLYCEETTGSEENLEHHKFDRMEAA